MSALRRELLVFALLAVGFVAVSLLVSSGGLTQSDYAFARSLYGLWSPSLAPLFHFLALLGGVEVTALALIGLAVCLLWRGYGADALAVLAGAAAVVVEEVYKRVVAQPPPPLSLSHGDGPSLATAFGFGGGNSFPSGHVARAVVAYGLIAFVIWRLRRPGWLRTLAVPVAVALVAVVAFDRLYLGLHWESDVVGGLFLGGTCLVGGMLWLDRPRKMAI